MKWERPVVHGVGLRIEHARKVFAGGVTAVSDASLAVDPAKMTTLLGPSGCGKTTLLRMIAGFEAPDTGRILLDEHDITRLPPSRRPISMVFQNYALFPHMTVRDNIAYGLVLRKVARTDRQRRVDQVMELVGLSGLGARPVAQLSGGQQQRVALARAVVVEPKVLLFDEPLSNLDAKLRERMREELRALHRRLGTTSVYVTHDQEEAFAISDTIAVMREGRIVQVGTPEEIYYSPASRYVAELVGKANWARATVSAGVSGDRMRVRIGDYTFTARAGNHVAKTAATVDLLIRPEALLLGNPGPGLTGTIKAVRFRGEVTELVIAADGQEWIVRQMVSGDRVPTAGQPAKVSFREGAPCVVGTAEDSAESDSGGGYPSDGWLLDNSESTPPAGGEA
jgi:iron(III) transport system ATP-binding protein